MISVGESVLGVVTKKIRAIQKRHSLTEIKWSETRNDIKVDAIIESIDAILNLIKKDEPLRIDVLVWNIEDSRHAIKGRDDIANLQRMYYHLLSNVMEYRWPKKSIWKIYPDENSSIDWNTLKNILSHKYIIEDLREIKSHNAPLIQIADIFAGMGAYSWGNIEKYYEWHMECRKDKQKTLFSDFGSSIKLSNKDKYRCMILYLTYQKIKNIEIEIDSYSHPLKGSKIVSLGDHGKGFSTKDPSFPINFWPYTPQTDWDKAPVKGQPFNRPRNMNIKMNGGEMVMLQILKEGVKNAGMGRV